MNRKLLSLLSAAILAISFAAAGCGDDEPGKDASGGSGGTTNPGGSGGSGGSDGGTGGTESPGGAGGEDGGQGGTEGEGGEGGQDGEGGAGGEGGEVGEGGAGGEGGALTESRIATINVMYDCWGICPGFVLVGDTAYVMAEALDADDQWLSDVTFTWSSEDEAIATVDQFGGVTGVSVGTVRIIAEAEGASGSLEVEVQDGL